MVDRSLGRSVCSRYLCMCRYGEPGCDAFRSYGPQKLQNSNCWCDLHLVLGGRLQNFNCSWALWFSDFLGAQKVAADVNVTRFNKLLSIRGAYAPTSCTRRDPSSSSSSSSRGEQQPTYCTMKAVAVEAVASVCSKTAGNFYAIFTSFFIYQVPITMV